MAATEDEREDYKTLEDNFLSGDLMPNDIDDDFIIGSDNKPGDDDDEEDHPDPNEEEGNEEDENEEGQEGSNEGAVGDDEEQNEFFLRAEYWKQIGRLDANTEIPKDITDIALEDLYLKQVDKNVINRIKTDIKDAIKAKGLDPDEIFGGESEDQYYQKEYTRISSIPYATFVEKNEDVTAALRILSTEYWISKSQGTLTEEDVEANVAKDLDKNDEEDLFNKYTTYFGAEAKKLEIKIRDDAKEKIRIEAEKAKNDAKYIRETLSSGKIGNKTYAPDVIEKVVDALTKKNQIYDDGRGDRRPVTLFKKRQLETESNIGSQLEMAVNMILGIDEKSIKEKSERVGSVNILQKLAKASASSSGDVQPVKNKKQNKVKTSTQEFEAMLLD